MYRFRRLGFSSLGFGRGSKVGDPMFKALTFRISWSEREEVRV